MSEQKRQSIDLRQVLADLAAKGIDVTGVPNEGVKVTRSKGIGKKSGKPYDGFQIKVGAGFPMYVSKGAAAALVTPAAIDAIKAALALAAKEPQAAPVSI